MKILCTGYKGFIGSYVKKLFPDAIGYDIKETPEDNVLNEQHLLHILKKNQIETVVHLAAYVSASDSEKFPLAYIKNNIDGTASVIQACLKARVKKIVYASSSAAYEPTSSIYALTKYVSELLLEYYKDQIQTVSLRIFNVYGQGSNPNYGRVIDEFIKGIKAKGEVTIYGDGNQTRDFIHAEDVVRSIQLAVKKDVPSGEVMDIGTGQTMAITTLAFLVGDLMNKRPKINYAPARAEVKYSRANINKAKQLLGFTAEIILAQGLKELISLH